MENLSKHSNIQIRSEEVRVIMSRKPHFIQRFGILIIFIFIVLLLVGSYFFPYPKMIESNISISSYPETVYIKSNINYNQLIFKFNDDVTVHKGDILAINKTEYNNSDILEIYNLINNWNLKGRDISDLDILLFDYIPNLGSVTESYCEFISMFYHYKKYYNNTNKILLTKSVLNLESEIILWIKTNAIISPADGILGYMPVNKIQQCDKLNYELFSIQPCDTVTYLGQTSIPAKYIDNLAIGQSAYVSVPSSDLSSNIIIESCIGFISKKANSSDNYMIDIYFPKKTYNQLKESFHNKNQIMGTISLNVDQRTVFEHLFKPKNPIKRK